MAVKIEIMDMPKSCMHCRFVDVYHDPVLIKHYYWCRARGQEVNGKKIRDKHCPLKELKEK